MSKNIVFVAIYHRHKLLDLIIIIIITAVNFMSINNFQTLFEFSIHSNV
jgi:hypothetical protein